jgi:hypothetical protein
MKINPSWPLFAGFAVGALWSGLCGVCAVVMTHAVYEFRSPLATRPPAPGQPVGEMLTRRVVLVLIDGLRDDTSRDARVMPFLNELRRQGASASMHSREPSRSQSGYATLLTGGWCEVSDAPARNVPAEQIYPWTADTLFAAAHRRGLKTAVSGLFWFERGLPKEVVDAGYYTHEADAAADAAVVEAGIGFLKRPDYQLVLLHIDQMDTAGHQSGARAAAWRAAAARADEHVRQIVSTLDLKQDTVLVVSDHGHIDRGGHGGGDRVVLTEPFVLAGQGVQPGEHGQVEMIDVAPTLAVLLGVNIPASSQGKVLSRMLKLSPGQIGRVEAALEIQQRQLSEAYREAIGYSAERVPGGETVSSYQQQMQAARAGRLRDERLVRAPPALIALALPALLLLFRRPAGWGRIFVGAALYLVLFHLGYVFLAGRTYTISNFTGAKALGLSTLLNTAITFGIAWVVTLVALGARRRALETAAETTLALILITLYLLAFPVLLHYAYNGIRYSWALPEFKSFFLALLAAAQSLSVTLVGGVLLALSVVIAKR